MLVFLTIIRFLLIYSYTTIGLIIQVFMVSFLKISLVFALCAFSNFFDIFSLNCSWLSDFLIFGLYTLDILSFLKYNTY